MQDIDRRLIRNIPDFPKPGIQFKDITPLLADPVAFDVVIEKFLQKLPSTNGYIAGIEARGFIFAAAVAKACKRGFIPIRKSGKLPGSVEKENYALEYGDSSLEIHKDIYIDKSSVVIVDDVLATGGTAIAAIKLCKKINLEVESIIFLMDIPELGGRSQIARHFPDLQISVLLAE
jgi:adenine phosphoribosyltransferase